MDSDIRQPLFHSFLLYCYVECVSGEVDSSAAVGDGCSGCIFNTAYHYLLAFLLQLLALATLLVACCWFAAVRARKKKGMGREDQTISFIYSFSTTHKFESEAIKVLTKHEGSNVVIEKVKP